MAFSSFARASFFRLAFDELDDVVVEYDDELLALELVETSFGGEPLLESNTAGAQSPVLVEVDIALSGESRVDIVPEEEAATHLEFL